MLLLFFLTMLLFASCEYEPDRIFERDVNENVLPPEFQVTGFDPTQDTIHLYSDQLISYSFNCDKKIKEMVFIMNHQIQCVRYSNSGTFLIPYSYLRKGYHWLKIEIYTHSGTNSIVDELGGEGYLTTFLWIIVVHRD